MRSLQWYKRGAAYETPINTGGVRGEGLAQPFIRINT